MHKFCTECEKHFVGKEKGMEIECKALGHTVITVSDEWDINPPVVPTTLKMNEYNAEWHGRAGTFLARIIARGDLEVYDSELTYECKVCNKTIKYVADNDRELPDEIPKCIKCSVKMRRGDAKVELIRSLILQEPFNEALHMTPMTMEGIVTGENAKNVYIGQDKILTGIFKSVKKKNTQKIIFDITKISDVGKRKDLIPSDEEINKFKEMQSDDWIQKLTDSFAPEIYGMKNEKEALILSLVSGAKIGDLRGDINTLLVGDPSTAKSRLLKYVLKITTKSAYALGRSTSAAGLVMGVDKLADGRNIIKAGPVVLCSGGCVCIDEIDKMADTDRSALHEVMEQQSATLNKIGSNLTMPAETIILAAANPKTSKYKVDLSISQNINMPDSLLSRFDLIFLIRDIAHIDNDIKKLRHISKVRQNDNNCEHLSIDEMTKLINYCKGLNPVLKPESMEMLENFYVKLRSLQQPHDALAIDMRGFEGLIRLATAHAKLRFCDTIDERDINEAIRLFQYSLGTFGMQTQGEMNQSMIIESMNKQDFVLETLHMICDADRRFNIKNAVKIFTTEGVKWFKTEVLAYDYIYRILCQKESLITETIDPEVYKIV